MKIGDKVTIYHDGKPYKNGVIKEIKQTKSCKKAIVNTEMGTIWYGPIEIIKLNPL